MFYTNVKIRLFYDTPDTEGESVEIWKFFAADVEGIDREAASTEWEKTRRFHRCGMRVDLPTRRAFAANELQRAKGSPDLSLRTTK